MYGKPFNVELIIQLDERVAYGFDGNDARLLIRPEVVAQLSGEHFQIKHSTTADQSIKNRKLIWHWAVLPLAAGHQVIDLHLVFSLLEGREEKTLSMWLTDRKVEVSNALNGVQECRVGGKSPVTIRLYSETEF